MSGRRSRRGALHFVLLGIYAGVFALVASIAALVLVIPAATGSVALTVLTSSMEPGLPPGSLVVVKPADPADVRIGSIITFQWESGNATLVTHRVVGVTTAADGGYAFTTRGDNNDEPDPNPVTVEQLQGIVWYSLPLLGWVSNLMAGDLRPILLPVIAGGLFVYAAVLIVQSLRGRREPHAAKPADPVEQADGIGTRRPRGSTGRRAVGASSTIASTAVGEQPAASENPAASRATSSSSESGPRRSTFVAPPESERPATRRGRRTAERAPGTGIDSFVAPPPEAVPETSVTGEQVGEAPTTRPRGRDRSSR